jgi:hypothetical protein
MTGTEELRPYLDRLQRGALLLGGAGLALCAGGAWLNLGQFLRSYLPAYLFWIGISLGCLALLMLHHLVGRGVPGAPPAGGRHAAPRPDGGAVPPLLLGLRDLYVWARPRQWPPTPCCNTRAYI